MIRRRLLSAFNAMNILRRISLASVAGLGFALLAGSPAFAQTMGEAGSAPQGSLWMPGHWVSQSGQWQWVAPHWEVPPSQGAAWVPGHWMASEGKWVWVNGAWSAVENPQSPATAPVPPAGAAVAQPSSPGPYPGSPYAVDSTVVAAAPYAPVVVDDGPYYSAGYLGYYPWWDWNLGIGWIGGYWGHGGYGRYHGGGHGGHGGYVGHGHSSYSGGSGVRHR